MKKMTLGILSAALIAACSVANAQLSSLLSIEILFDGNDVTPITTATGVEFDTIAVTPDGGTVYLFDSVGTFDGLLAFDGTNVSIFATEAQLAAGSASAGDLAADDTNLYTSIFDGTDQRIWRIPHAGGFASAVNMVDETGGNSDNMDEIAIDSKNDRLVISYNDAFEGVTENIVHVPLNGTAVAPTLLASETDIEAVLATIPGYEDDDPSRDDLNITDMTVQSDGDVIFAHGFPSTRPINGSLLRVTETGTISVFRTAADIKTAAGVNPADVNIGSVQVAALPNDEILILVSFSSDNAALDPFVAIVSEDGTEQRKVATQSELTSGLTAQEQSDLIFTGQGLFRFDSKASLGIDSNGDLYFYRQGGSNTALSEHAVLKVSGVTAVELSADQWHLHQ